MSLKLKTILTILLLLSSLSSFACSCLDETVPFCDLVSPMYNNSIPLVFIGETTGNCIDYDDPSSGGGSTLCEVRVDEILSGSITMLDESQNYPVSNTDTTLWIYTSGHGADCTYLAPSGKKIYAPFPIFNEFYSLSICVENFLSIDDGQVSGYVTAPEPLDEFLVTLESCLPKPDCGDFDAWLGISGIDVNICGGYYNAILLLKGYDFTVNDSFTIIDNLSGDTTVTSNSSLTIPEIYYEYQYSFTVYLTDQPECSETVEGYCTECLDDKFNPDQTEGLYLENDEYVYDFTIDSENPNNEFSLTMDVLANDPCSPDCVIFVDGDASTFEVFGDFFYSNDENNANITINDDCTITYEGNASTEESEVDYFIYGFLNWQGDTVRAIVKVNIDLAIAEPSDPTFEFYIDVVCDRISGEFSLILSVFEPTEPFADNYQYRVCNDEWVDMGSSNSNILVFEALESYAEGSSICIEIRDNDFPDAILNYSIETLNCSTVAIELLSFEGINTSYGNEINWSTATEKDNDYFVLEKSFDGISFNSMARIHSNGDSNIQQDYQFVDEENTKQTSYYRLATVDHSGKREIVSKVISLQSRQPNQDIVLYPLPANSFVYLNVLNDLNEQVKVDVFDVSGKLILQKTFEVENGQNHLEIDINALSNGVYVLNYKSSTGAVVKRFLK